MGFAKKSFELSRLFPLKSFVAVGSSFYPSSLLPQIVYPSSYLPTTNDFGTKRSNTKTPSERPLHCNNRFSFAELQNTKRFLLRANQHVRNKKEPNTTVLENASLRNYDISEVCLSVTSHTHQLPKILFPFLSFDVCIIRGRFVVVKI